MKIAELHESEADMPGVDVNETFGEKYFEDFEHYANVVEFGGFVDTFDEALKVAGSEALESLITFDYSSYEEGDEDGMPTNIFGVLMIQQQPNYTFNVLQFKPEKFTKGMSKSQLDALIRKLSKKIEHEEVEIEFRVLGKT